LALSARIGVLTASFRYNQAQSTTTAAAINDYLAWRIARETNLREMAENGELDDVLCPINDARLHISVVPHAALVSLNSAQPDLLASGFLRFGFNLREAEALAMEIARFRMPRPQQNESDIDIVGGYKRSAFEDIAELHDFSSLRDISTYNLAEVFSVQSGRSILSQSDVVGLGSQHFTIGAFFLDDQTVIGDAAIFQIGGHGSPAKRVASIGLPRPEKFSKQTKPCNAIIDQAAINLLTEIL
jgi:hypothetical protein